MVTGTVVPLLSSNVPIRSAVVHCFKSQGVDNSATIYAGLSATDGQNLQALAAGQTYTVSMPDGTIFDPSAFYLDGTTGDVAWVEYWR